MINRERVGEMQYLLAVLVAFSDMSQCVADVSDRNEKEWQQYIEPQYQQEVLIELNTLLTEDMASLLQREEPLVLEPAPLKKIRAQVMELENKTLKIATAQAILKAREESEKGCKFFLIGSTLKVVREYLRELYDCADSTCSQEDRQDIIAKLLLALDHLDSKNIDCIRTLDINVR